MSYITKLAEKFAERNIEELNGGDENHIMSLIHDELAKIFILSDKIKFTTILLEKNECGLRDHVLKCKTKDCLTQNTYEAINFYLNQELYKLGFNQKNDQFSTEEKIKFESFLNELMEEIQTLKNGQQIIHEDLMGEIEELKELFFLGKKNWKQLLIGKIQEKGASFLIGKIVTDLSNDIQKLI